MSTVAAVNHQVRLASRPVGMPIDANWQFTDEPVNDPGAGGVLVQVLALSLDPAMRGWMNEGRSYIRPVEIGRRSTRVSAARRNGSTCSACPA